NAQRLHVERDVDQSLDLLGDGAHLSIVSSGRDDEGVEGVNEFAQVEHDRVATELVLGGHHRGVHQGGDKIRVWAARSLAARYQVTQWDTPSTTSAATKGTVSDTTPMTAYRCFKRRTSLRLNGAASRPRSLLGWGSVASKSRTAIPSTLASDALVERNN